MRVQEIVDNVLVTEFVNASISADDINDLFKIVEELNWKYEHVNLMILVEEFPKLTKELIYSSIVKGIQDRKVIHKIAIVGEERALKLLVPLENLVVPWSEKYFDIKDMDDAWNWLKQETV
ncbi:STAS/SEC14 domain-containing protein [Puteibacter caeruleilacunae]|nr:STAS/SEC14 domain-containing protein [Puteibacter caeruleilacunae]